MKILAVSTEGAGHITPLVPLLGALVAGGDEVLVASERILHYFLPRAFGEIVVDEMVDDALRLGHEFAPDVVLFEACALAGPLVAELLGVPSVARPFGPLPPREAVEMTNDSVSPIWRSFGRDVPGWAGMHGQLTIQICPPGLDPVRVPTRESWPLRPVLLPIGPPDRTDRPVVYVTFGTLFNADLDRFRLALEALADEPVDVVMTVGRDQDPAALGPVPTNVRAERFIPQAELLPSCRAEVHHGGAGTTFGALAHGVPQVILPQGADNFEHATMCGRASTAITLRPDRLSPTHLGAAVRRVVDDEACAAASLSGAEEIAAMPDAVSVAAALRSWVSGA